MTMLAMAWFDFVRRLRMVSTYVYFVVFGAMAGFWMAAAGGALASASVSFGGDKILINGTYAIAIGVALLSFLGITVIGSVVGRAVQQDYEYGTYHFFFSAPITKRDYFMGPDEAKAYADRAEGMDPEGAVGLDLQGEDCLSACGGGEGVAGDAVGDRDAVAGEGREG